MKHTHITVCFIVLVLIFIVPAQSWAIDRVSPSPARKTVNVDRPINITIVWRIHGSGVTAPVVVEADDGAFFLGSGAGTQIAPNPGTLSRTLNTIAGGMYDTTFTETITVSRSIMQQARQAKMPLYYQREFSDDGFGTSIFAGVTINLGSGIAGELEVSRLRLDFEGGQTLCTVTVGEDLRANAYISTDGTGVLRGRWQVRTDPYAASFITLKNVRLQVNAGRDIKLKSPSLPTDASGRVDVRLLLDNPDPGFEEPFVTCLIKGTDNRMKAFEIPGAKLNVVSPAPYSPLNSSSVIEWESHGDYKSYRIVFLRQSDGKPVAAQDAPKGAHQAKISPLTLEKLDPQLRYLAQVYGQ